MIYTVIFRRRVVANTDPQRRCYDGCHFSTEEVWSDWNVVCPYASREDAESAIATFAAINPDREYRIEPSENPA